MMLLDRAGEVARAADATAPASVTQRAFDATRAREKRFSDVPKARQVAEKLGLPWHEVTELAQAPLATQQHRLGKKEGEAKADWVSAKHVTASLQIVAARLRRRERDAARVQRGAGEDSRGEQAQVAATAAADRGADTGGDAPCSPRSAPNGTTIVTPGRRIQSQRVGARPGTSRLGPQTEANAERRRTPTGGATGACFQRARHAAHGQRGSSVRGSERRRLSAARSMRLRPRAAICHGAAARCAALSTFAQPCARVREGPRTRRSCPTNARNLARAGN